MLREALFYKNLPDGQVICSLCSHNCHIKPGQRGLCQVRENQAGTLMSLVWGRPITLAVDPIEKKPLFHFLPSSLSFSLATLGCNFQCAFCQNWQISQATPEYKREDEVIVAPEEVIKLTLANNCKSISYTYTEPTVYFEYAADCMEQAQKAGLANVFVSNGFQSEACLASCKGLLQAANVDLKSFRDKFYREVCRARLAPVLDSLRLLKTAGTWLEITTLLIPGKNDESVELKELAQFIAQELSTDVPWHVSAYRPHYKYAGKGPSSTPPRTLLKAQEIGLEAGLHHVYIGNAPGLGGEDTICPQCETLLLRRMGFAVKENNLRNGACPTCGRSVAGVWQ